MRYPECFSAELPASFHLCRERCTLRIDPDTREQYLGKNIQKLKRRGYDLRRIVCIDDSPEKYRWSYGNYIRVPEYRGQLQDDVLGKLLVYLETLRDVADVRSLEKRNWPSATQP